MSRKRIGPSAVVADAKGELVDRLASELKEARDYGQPFVFEEEFSTKKIRVNVIWDRWAGVPLEERSATILKAYETVEGPDFRRRIALASGLTVPEAYAAGMLSYQVVAGRRQGDPVTEEQVRQAMLEEGGSVLADPSSIQLRFRSEEDAEAARRRLTQRLPGSGPIWILLREVGKVEDLPF